MFEARGGLRDAARKIERFGTVTARNLRTFDKILAAAAMSTDS